MIQVKPKNFSLRPYQKEGVRFLYKLKRSLLCDVPGLGKTIQAICCLNAWCSPRVVIICPAQIRLNWEAEWGLWDIHSRRCFVVSSGDVSAYRGQPVVICSYSLLDNKDVLELLTSLSKFALVCDEYHYCKSWSARRTNNVIFGLMKNASRFIGLTGTPITRSVGDIHPLASSVSPGSFSTYKTFMERYSTPTYDGYGIVYKGFRNKSELKDKLRPLMIRRFKKDVLKELPSKSFKDCYFTIPEELRLRSLKFSDYREGDSDLPGFSTVYRELGNAKSYEVAEYCSFLFENGSGPVVVFAHHRDVLSALEFYLEDAGYRVGTVCGGDTEWGKTHAIKKFESGSLDFIVCSLTAATGYTLVRGSTCVVAEIPVSPHVLTQATDRLHRIGQTSSVVVHMCRCKNSLDDLLGKIVTSKQGLVTSLVGAE